jgi:hypothetical protein
MNYIKTESAKSVPNADFSGLPYTKSIDVKSNNSQPNVHYGNVDNREFFSKDTLSDTFPQNNGTRLVTDIKEEQTDATCVCTDTKLEIVDNTYMTQTEKGYQYSTSKPLGNNLPLGKMESDTKLLKTEMASTLDPADPRLCDMSCMYDSYASVNIDRSVSHPVVELYENIGHSVKEHTPTVTPAHGKTPFNGRAHTGDSTHTCDVCMKSFAHKSKLDQHTRTHTGDKPYTCGICMQSFSQKSTLVPHTRTHTGKKTTNVTCVWMHSLRNHLWTHTLEYILLTNRAHVTCV